VDGGLIERERYDRVVAKQGLIMNEVARLKSLGLTAELRRPEVNYRISSRADRKTAPVLSREVEAEVECLVKYEGYIARQEKEISRIKELENNQLPRSMDYAAITTLSLEVREKLERIQPATLGQAARIPGVTPAAIAILAVYLRGRGAKNNSSADHRAF